MSEVVKKQRKVLIENTIKALSERNMEGFYAENKEEALNISKQLLSNCKVVSCGGSMTMKEIGLYDELENGEYDFLNVENASSKEEVRDIMIKAYDADAYIGSVNAMTSDGILVNIDGNSNRVSAYAFGPKKVILIVGVQKIMTDLDEALKRSRNVASPMNCTRLDKKNPCVKTGKCMDCKSLDTICCQFLITRFSRHKDRIKIILVNEEVGY